VALPVNTELGWKDLPGDERSSLFRPLVKYGRKKDFNVGRSADAVVVKDLKSVLLQKSFFSFPFCFCLKILKTLETFLPSHHHHILAKFGNK
jgi:hypothetical protein